MKKIVLGLAIVALLAIVVSCGTVPTGAFGVGLSVKEVLGPVPADQIGNYEESLAAAKKLYPNAEAVIYVTAKGGNKMIPWTVKVGYFAVTIQGAEVVGGLF